MREHYFRYGTIVTLQRIFWLLFVALFGLATAFYAAGHRYAGIAATGGTFAILLLVAVITVTIAELFRMARLYRYWLLSYMLLTILLSTILLRMYFSG